MKATCIALLLLTLNTLAADPISLFDGKSFKGWKIQKGEEQWWKIENGEIVGGSLDKKIEHNTFITTEKRYTNFELNLKVKLEIVKRSDDVKGFKILPKRWIVERTFEWLIQSRRLVRDYEVLPRHS